MEIKDQWRETNQKLEDTKCSYEEKLDNLKTELQHEKQRTAVITESYQSQIEARQEEIGQELEEQREQSARQHQKDQSDIEEMQNKIEQLEEENERTAKQQSERASLKRSILTGAMVLPLGPLGILGAALMKWGLSDRKKILPGNPFQEE